MLRPCGFRRARTLRRRAPPARRSNSRAFRSRWRRRRSRRARRRHDRKCRAIRRTRYREPSARQARTRQRLHARARGHRGHAAARTRRGERTRACLRAPPARRAASPSLSRGPARHGQAPRASRPSIASSSSAAGVSQSPQVLSRGNRARSISVTASPRAARCQPAAAPAGTGADDGDAHLPAGDHGCGRKGRELRIDMFNATQAIMRYCLGVDGVGSAV